MKKVAARTTTLHQAQRVTVAHLHPMPLLLDTAWRIGLPVATLSALGALADNYFDAGPWLALLGLMVGFVIAGILVKHQTTGEPSDEK